MLVNLPALLLFAFAASLTPGPNNLMLMTSGLNFGLRRTLPHFWGVDAGYGMLALAVGLGLAGVLVREPALLVALKWAGAAYLLWLAIRIARSAAPQSDDRGASANRPLSFGQAVAFQWVNPKAWLGAVTAMATFTAPRSYVPSVVVVTLVMMLVNLPCAALWTACGSGLQRLLARPGARAAFNITLAILLVASLYPMLLG